MTAMGVTCAALSLGTAAFADVPGTTSGVTSGQTSGNGATTSATTSAVTSGNGSGSGGGSSSGSGGSGGSSGGCNVTPVDSSGVLALGAVVGLTLVGYAARRKRAAR
jgi:hypothetical protein